jgi:hypothetical protein
MVLANGDGVGINERNDGLPSVFAMARRLFQEAERF